MIKMIEYYHELEEPELLTLQDEEGVESVVELLAQMDVDGKSYVAATPHLDDPTQTLGEDAELIVLVSEEEDGEEFLASIDDDDEYEKIGNLFLEKLMGYYEDEPEEEEEFFPADGLNRTLFLTAVCRFYAFEKWDWV